MTIGIITVAVILGALLGGANIGRSRKLMFSGFAILAAAVVAAFVVSSGH